jgi:hypothetical protein
LLAVLDFDMAFIYSSFVEKQPHQESIATRKKFDELLLIEQNAMKCALAGDELLNSGVTGTTKLDNSYLIVKWALRYYKLLIFLTIISDTLLKGFLFGFKAKQQLTLEFNQELKLLVNLAIILTINNIS